MAEVNLSTFPDGKVEALAYLYVQKKNYDNPTPKLLAEDYMHAYKEIHGFFSEHRNRTEWR